MSQKKKFYITTPIYYPSAAPHLGHGYCTVMADILKRSKALRGYETFFLTGLDEHGEKIAKNAMAQGMTPQAFVDEEAKEFKNLWSLLKISNDDFIRTTEKRHVETVQSIFSDFLKQGDVYLSEYKGWYCVHEETYWAETQLLDGHLCPECHRPVEEKKEGAYFFRCQKYVDFLLDYYKEHPMFVVPEGRKTEMINNFIKPGLSDLCVTRTSFDWGIPIKEAPGHVIYVWLDALANYLSALGYRQKDDSLFQKFWNDPDTEIVHLIGADITRFHVIYWPMFLKALNLREPNTIFVHGLMMTKEGKMSKSKGNVIPPVPMVERYGVDAVRWYLAREIVFGQDGEFTPEQFVERINADLANSLGNLLNRSLAMIDKYFAGIIPQFSGAHNELDSQLISLISSTIDKYESLMDSLKLSEAQAIVMALVDAGNKYLAESAPWSLAKDETKKEELETCLSLVAHVLFVAGLLLSPVLVTKAPELLEQLGVSDEFQKFENLKQIGVLSGLQIKKGNPLFPRLETAKEIDYIKNIMLVPHAKAAA